MKTNTTSVTITFRLVNDDIKGSIEAIKALIATLNETDKLEDAPPVTPAPVEVAK